MLGPSNHERLIQSIREQAARERVERGPDWDASADQRIRNGIEDAKQRGREGENVGERLLELRRQHYDLTGSSGG